MAQVLVDAKKWNPLSQVDKDRITEIMRTSGMLSTSDSIAGSVNPPPPPAAKFLDANPTCVLGVNAAETVAVAACAAVPPPGNLICVAVAHAVAAFARSKC